MKRFISSCIMPALLLVAAMVLAVSVNMRTSGDVTMDMGTDPVPYGFITNPILYEPDEQAIETLETNDDTVIDEPEEETIETPKATVDEGTCYDTILYEFIKQAVRSQEAINSEIVVYEPEKQAPVAAYIDTAIDTVTYEPEEQATVTPVVTGSMGANTDTNVPATEPIVSQPVQVASAIFVWDHGGNYTGPITIREVSASGIFVEETNEAVIDYSNTSNGYVMVKRLAGNGGFVRVEGPNGITYKRDYLLKNLNQYYPIPLQYGNGVYNILVAVSEDNYQTASYLVLACNVTLSSPDINFLYPSVFVNYNSSSAVIKKSFDLCMNAKSDLEKVQSIYGYLTENFIYTLNAENNYDEYIPNLDQVLAAKKGKCFDFASMMAAMCRAQGIKTKLIFGYSLGELHAWVEVYVTEPGLITEGIQSNGGWKRLDPTYAICMMVPGEIENLQYNGREIY